MAQLIKCSTCDKEYNIPFATTFSKNCICGTQIFRNTSNGIVLFRTQSKPVQRLGLFVERVLIWSIPVLCLTVLSAFAVQRFNLNINKSNEVSKEVAVSSTKAITTTYSGTCTQYKLTLVNGNQKKYTSIAKAFAKITIDHTAKKFTFVFNGKLVYSYTRFDSYQDNERGIEGYSFSGDWSAMRSNSEGTFTVYNSLMGKSPDLGYEYEITNYKLN
jgi:hypothetical protein